MMNNSILDDFKHAWNRPNNAVIQIILINLIVFLFLLVIQVIFFLSEAPGLYAAILRKLMLPADLGLFITQPWTLVTYFFTHESFFHILFNMLFLFWFGRIITEFLGSNRVIALYVLGGLAGGLFYILMYNLLPFFHSRIDGSLMLGASAGVYAIVVGAATFMPNYTFHLLLIGPVKIKYIALFYVIVSFAGIIGQNAGGDLAHLAGAGLGFLYITQLQKGTDLGTWIIQFMDFVKSFFISKPKIKVTHRGESKGKSRRSAKSQTDKSSSDVEQDEIDRILDKISQSGYESLSKEEKQKLFNASKK